MRKKVLIITPWYPTPSLPVGGIFVQDQALVLSKEYDVYVLALVLTDWKEFFSRSKKVSSQKGGEHPEGLSGSTMFFEKTFGTVFHHPQNIEKTPKKAELELSMRANKRIKIDGFYTLPGMRFFYSLYFYFYQKQLEKKFAEVLSSWGKPDVIHAHVVLPAGAAALKIGRLHKIPVVLTEHTEPFSLHLRTPVYRRLTRKTLLGMNKIIAVSPSLKEQILQFEPDTGVEVIGNVIDDAFFSPAAPNQKKDAIFRFLTVAMLTERKGIGYLIEAVKLLSQETSSQFEVIIGGDGPIRAELERRAENLGVMKYCRFTGALNRTEVRDWINQSDVFVLPSLGETFGVVLLEAMLCGRPVIATRCGGPEDLVTPESGVLVNAADPTALAKAMNDFMKNEDRFNPQDVRNNAIERYGQTTFLRKIAQLYDDL
jgi:glycosyltransferase involved in cell wall biosynthesis